MAYYALFNDPMHDEAPIPNSAFSEFEDKGDGVVALKNGDAGYVSQNPNKRGEFSYAPEAKAYEMFGGGAGVGIKTSWTRPQADPPDKIFSYFCLQLPNA
jgi:hypothetical protein